MTRIRRMVVKVEDVLYHVMPRMALDGYVLGDKEKEHLLRLIIKLSSGKGTSGMIDLRALS